MKVAVDTNCILPGQVGGIENYTLGLIEALKLPQSPVEKLVLLTRPENHSLMSKYADERTEIVLLERAAKNWDELRKCDPDRAQKALIEFQRRKVDALHRRGVELIHFPGNTINPMDIDLPVVLNLHDLQHRHFPEYFSEEEIARREKWWVMSGRRADALIAGSNFIRDDLCEQLGVDRSKIFVTPDVFEMAFMRRPASEQLDDLRRRYELPGKFFIYPAAAWPHKNHQRLIEAFKWAAIEGSQLILTGAGHEEAAGSDNVRFLGRVSTEDLVGLYCLATALVFPSQYESWSIPIMEAMACGCPVASSNVTSLGEQVGAAGLLFDPTDIPGMAKAMQVLAGSKFLRQTLAKRGADRVREFSPENFIQTVSQAYEFARSAHRTKRAA
jgi:glycosyltransferase involved in cell wall biosynthesis